MSSQSWLPHPSHISDEFERLETECYPRRLELQARIAISNMSANRYSNIFPLDSGRVILSAGSHGDYINASHVREPGKPDGFIMTQGPIDRTIPDFWKMVHQYSASVIVCVTDLMDRGSPKCAKYWIGKTASTSHFNITPSERLELKYVSKEIFARGGGMHAVRRHFLLNGRPVTHYHLKGFPDYGVPDTKIFLTFLRAIEAQMDTKALYGQTPESIVHAVVHCSAGIGRSGMVVAALQCMKRFRNSGGTDRIPVSCVADSVRCMRASRPFSVQTGPQYRKVFETLDLFFKEELAASASKPQTKPLPASEGGAFSSSSS